MMADGFGDRGGANVEIVLERLQAAVDRCIDGLQAATQRFVKGSHLAVE